MYRPQLRAVLRWPKATLVLAALALAATAYPILQLGGEFMPPLDEGDLLYMPTALPDLSAGKAGELLQQTNKMIRQIPEVMQRIAAPMVGGMITAPLLSMLVIPAAYLLLRRRACRRNAN